MKLYIDGQAGTTALRIRDWLAERRDFQLITLPEAQRRQTPARRDAVLEADIAILCLPDEAAREVAQWVQNEGQTRLIDASTAHRVAPGWVYGLPELQNEQREHIRRARYVSNPGCYSSSFILLVRPLIDAGLLTPEAPLFIHALSGYSGGGRQLIEHWQDPQQGLSTLPYEAPYAFERVHKHIPEMIHYAGLNREPQFSPAVGPFHSGMRVHVPLHADLLGTRDSAQRIWQALHARYAQEPFVQLIPLEESISAHEKTYDPQRCNASNRIELRVLAHPSGHVTLMAIQDNLGKGASGMAIQSLNLMLGVDEQTSLPV